MENLICTVEEGKLKGQLNTDFQGSPFLSFNGVPYAKPPIGELRFKAPQPPKKWEGIRDATKQGNPCYSLQLFPTLDGLKAKLAGSEDCLFLDIYTRQLLKDDQDELKPVMLFIHGGGFVIGSSKRSEFGPEFLMTGDIVLITINYRLGALGFLKIDDPSLEVTGNAGLKDQVQALKWVQKNIKQFGGDPNNVTVFGHSAGGASVHYLILSPSAKGLFHKAILQSGTVLCPWAHGVNNAKKLAQMIGCTESSNQKILEFLQEVPVEKLLKAQNQLPDSITVSSKRAFSPSVEAKTEAAFLSEDPLSLLNSGTYNHVPMMMGYTNREGIMEAHINDADLLLPFQSNFEDFVPFYFGYPKHSQVYKDTNKRITQFYFGEEKPDPSKKEDFYTVLTDTVFLNGVNEAVKIHAKTSQEPIYYYRVSVDTNLNNFKKMVKAKTKGASHGDEIGHLFKMANTTIEPGSIEEISIHRFVKIWTNFARTGNPNPVEASFEWKPVTETELNFLDIGSELVPGTDPDVDRMNFWEEISQGIDLNY